MTGPALQAGDQRLVLDPGTGGAIASWTVAGVAVLRPVADPKLGAQHGRAVAAYPLMPFCNRVGWGRFASGGRTYTLARNFGDDPHPIHGNAWMRPWTVAANDATSTRLVFAHDPARDGAEHWPFAYEAEQRFTLAPEGLSLHLALRNTDTRPMPAGLGFHPYLARGPAATFRFQAEQVWPPGEDELPTAPAPVAGEYDFAAPRIPPAAPIDACYSGWTGAFALRDPGSKLDLTLTATETLRHLQLFTPAGRDYAGVEPVSAIPDALNRAHVPGSGYRCLAPGHALEATLRLAARLVQP
jgi:aldose 1-epimerase